MPVEGVVSIVDELQNPDGIWVRIGRESMGDLAPNHSEGWCLQYNNHLNKTLMVPVAAEEGRKKLTPTMPSPAPIMPPMTAAAKMAVPLHAFSSSPEPTLRQKKSNDERNKILSRGPGYYTVVKCGPSGHNIRCRPKLNAVPVGMVGLGDTLRAVAVKEDRQTGETWLQLAQETADQRCFAPSGGSDAWALAVSSTNVTHLESQLAAEEKKRAAEAEAEAEMAMMQRQVQMAAMQQIRMAVTGGAGGLDPAVQPPTASIQPPQQPKQCQQQGMDPADCEQTLLQAAARPTPTRRKSEGVMLSRNSPVDFGIAKRAPDQKPTPPPRHSLSMSVAKSASPSRRTPSPAATSSAPGPVGPKPSFFQKLFEKGSRRGSSSASPPAVRRPMPPPPPPQAVNRDIPPELQGVSVKELVKVIGESRANGNGVTPPGTPGSMRRSSRSVSPQVSSISSSSPVSIAHAASSQPIAVASGDVQLARQDSSQSDTSALISSLTRDLSQSPGETSGGSPASISLRSEAATIPRRSSRSPRRRHHHQHVLHHHHQQQQSQAVESFESGAASALAKSLTSIASSEAERPKGITTSSSNKTISSAAGMTVVEQQSKDANKHEVEAAVEKEEQEAKHATGTEESPFILPGGPVKEAMSPSVAESIRSVFAAFIWHEGIVHDAMAAAAFLKFHPSLSKEEELLAAASAAAAAASSSNNPPPVSKKDRVLQRHSVEVISTAYLKSRQVHNSSALDSLEKSAMNANANRNLTAPKQQQQQSERIPEEESQPAAAEERKEIAAEPPTPAADAVLASKLPPTMRLLVLLWEEVRSYCHHAILQQVILGSPLAQLPSKKSDKKDRKSKKRRKTTATAGSVFGDFEKREVNEPWPSIPTAAGDKESKDGGAKEAFIQMCDMCGLYFQVREFHVGTHFPYRI